MNAEELLVAALAKVDSASIRAWAQTDQNRPIFVKIAQSILDNPNGRDVEERMTVAIVGNAIGLF